MRNLFILAAAVVAWASMSQPAVAATDAYTTSTLNVRAGPGGAYPVIGRIAGRTAVDIKGCTAGMRWCDVSARGFRGWVAGERLNARHRNRQSTVMQLGSRLGLPVVTYNERAYWSTNYYDRDFYRARYGWNREQARQYGWQRNGNTWVRSSKWRDYDYDNDGISNRRDRDDDNDGIGDRYDNNDRSYRPGYGDDRTGDRYDRSEYRSDYYRNRYND